MNRLKQLKITTLVVASLLVACGGTKGNKADDKAEVAASPAERPTPAALYNFRVVKEYPHSMALCGRARDRRAARTSSA